MYTIIILLPGVRTERLISAGPVHIYGLVYHNVSNMNAHHCACGGVWCVGTDRCIFFLCQCEHEREHECYHVMNWACVVVAVPHAGESHSLCGIYIPLPYPRHAMAHVLIWQIYLHLDNWRNVFFCHSLQKRESDFWPSPRPVNTHAQSNGEKQLCYKSFKNLKKPRGSRPSSF